VLATPSETSLSALCAPHLPYALSPPRLRIQDLHGPRDALGSRWSEPSLATERWEHGQLVATESQARLDTLRAHWGQERTARAGVRPGAIATQDDALTGAAAAPSDRWPGMLQRAFDHVGCKAAHVGAMSPQALTPFGSIGDALWATRRRPRRGALRELLATFSGDAEALYGELDAVDRALDDATGDAPWIFGQVPDHCRQLWPLRNVMRLAERQGVLLREMSFTAFEAEDSFVPDLPVACLDATIYGGGFDHDLFHHLLPVSPPEDAFDFEASMLVVESAAQAYNSLVLASRYTGPTYEGHAPWTGAALFDRLSASFHRGTVPELVAAYARLGLVCHPQMTSDPVSTWRELLGPCEARALPALVAEHARYVRLDAAWLRTLRPRYESPS
jgi:hypothetical protein